MNRIKPYLLSEKTYSFLIAAVLISLPLRHAFSNTTLIVLLAVSLASVRFHKATINKAQLLPIGFFILMIVSLLWTVNTKDSFRGLERHLPYLLIPVLYITMPPLSKNIFLKVFYSFAIGLALFALFFIGYAVMDYLANGNSEIFFYHQLVEVKPLKLGLNAIYISVMVAFSLLFMIFYSKRKFIDWGVSIILLIFLVLLSSKNVFITTLFAGGLGLFLSKKITLKRVLFLGVLTVGLFSVIMLSPLKDRINQELTSNVEEVFTQDKFNRVYPWTGTTIRLFQARIGYELLNENNLFLTGFGVNASKNKIEEKRTFYNLYWGYNDYNFHNQYIQAFVELGVFGFLFILLFLVIIFKGYLKEKELIYLFFFILMISVFITESYIWRQRGMIFFFIVYGLLLKINEQKTSSIAI